MASDNHAILIQLDDLGAFYHLDPVSLLVSGYRLAKEWGKILPNIGSGSDADGEEKGGEKQISDRDEPPGELAASDAPLNPTEQQSPPTQSPTQSPTPIPTSSPTRRQTPSPTTYPTTLPTESRRQTLSPTTHPTILSTGSPTMPPTTAPPETLGDQNSENHVLALLTIGLVVFGSIALYLFYLQLLREQPTATKTMDGIDTEETRDLIEANAVSNDA